ncbi:response regulator [Paenibacillus sp. GCM10027626]|uniref:response regulator n=1 Tax=Paenibacillus sp. GCM10027626 TaxID=3273411 RepID=UPI0036383446
MIRAVIVDDDMTTLHGLQKSVPWGEFGIDLVGVAMNGQEGLEQIELHRPDLILTDVYMPVMNGIQMLESMRERGITAVAVILSGYEDFKVAQAALQLQVFNFLSKPATLTDISHVLRGAAEQIRSRRRSEQEDRELRELLEIHLPETRKQLFKGLLEPNFCETAFFKKVSQRLKLNFARQYFAVVMLEYAVTWERADYKTSDLPTFAYGVKNIVEEMNRTRPGVQAADIQSRVIVLLVSVPADVRKEFVMSRVKLTAREYADNIRSFLKLHVWAAVGKPVDSVQQIPASYQEASRLLAEKDSMGDAWLLSEDELQGRESRAIRHPLEIYHKLVEAVVEGQVDLIAGRIRELTGLLLEQGAPGIGKLRDIAIELMGMLAISLYESGIQMETIHPGMRLYKDIERLTSIRDFEAWLKEIMLPAAEAMSSRGTHKHRKTVDFIKRYVQEHYAEDLTLDVIADKVYLTRNYLSQIFKQVTGENYNQYLTQIRMEKAKELMASGKYKLYEIALLVGYKNNAYFSQQFKRYWGCNPSEFG